MPCPGGSAAFGVACAERPLSLSLSFLTGGFGGALTCGGGAGGTLGLTLETAMTGSSDVVGAGRGTFDREHHASKASPAARALVHRGSCKRGGDITRKLQVAVRTMIAPRQRDMKAMTQIVTNRQLAKRVHAAAAPGSTCQNRTLALHCDAIGTRKAIAVW